ncbi:MAG: serine--tRNA ligase [Chloroflexi bacterium]|nr:serine--tRNA ligase [Chloroflexota bacterium]
MISIELLREQPDLVRRAMRARGTTDASIDQILELDTKRRAIIVEADELRARRNAVSKEIGRMKPPPKEMVTEMREVGTRIKGFEEETRTVDEQISSLLLMLPNLPSETTPLGKDAADNVPVRTVGEQRTYDFDTQAHWDIGERLGIIDFERGVKLSGSRFYVLRGKGARLQRALIDWMLDVHTEEHGYEEVYVPYLVTSATVTGSGQLPKFADTMYRDAEEDFWLIPTAEVPITGMFVGEILSEDALPMQFVAHTPCFRREKAAAGKDTRGIKRVHQFEKVEMYKFVRPETSEQELEDMLANAEGLCKRLEIPYRIIELCTGDLGFSATKTYDIEMWAPGSEEWLEVSSSSNCTDFQSRRSNIRYRPAEGKRVQFPHTLNASGLALPRVIAAILENYQQADGSVLVPEVLRPYTRFDRIG